MPSIPTLPKMLSYKELRASKHSITNHANTSAVSITDRWNDFGEKSRNLKQLADSVGAPSSYDAIEAEYQSVQRNPRPAMMRNPTRYQSLPYLREYAREKKEAYDSFTQSAARYKATKDPESKSELNPVDFARKRLAQLFNIGNGSALADAVTKKDVTATLALLESRKPGVQISPADCFSNNLPERLLGNEDNFNYFSKTLGGNAKAVSFIEKLLTKMFKKDLDKGIGSGQWKEPENKDNSEAAKQLAKETIDHYLGEPE